MIVIPLVSGTLLIPLWKTAPSSSTDPITLLFSTRSFTSACLMEYGSGAASGFFGGFAARSTSLLYSSSVSVTLPGSGRGSVDLSSAQHNDIKQTHPTNIEVKSLPFIAHLPFYRAGN